MHWSQSVAAMITLMMALSMPLTAQVTCVPIRGVVHSIIPMDADRAIVVEHDDDSVSTLGGGLRYEINVAAVYVVHRDSSIDTLFQIANTNNEYEFGSYATHASSDGESVFVSFSDKTDTGYWPAGTLQISLQDDVVRWHPFVKDVVLRCSRDSALVAVIDPKITYRYPDSLAVYDLGGGVTRRGDPLGSVRILRSTLSTALCADGIGNTWFVSNCGEDTTSIADTSTYVYEADRVSDAFIRRERGVTNGSHFELTRDGGRSWTRVDVPIGIRYTTVLGDGTIIGESFDKSRQRSILHVLPQGSTTWSAVYATPDSMMIDTLHGASASAVFIGMSKDQYRSYTPLRGSLVCFADLTATTSIDEHEVPDGDPLQRPWRIVDLRGVIMRQGFGAPDTTHLEPGLYLIVSNGSVEKIMR